MDDIHTSYAKEEAAREKRAKEDGPKLLEVLIALKQTKTIRIEFSGCGDSGGIDTIEGIAENHLLYKQVDEWAEEFGNTLPDWWNNEGGCGWIEMNPKTGKITYEVSQFEQKAEVADRGEF